MFEILLSKNMRFPLVIIDEGSQCTEPETLVPLTKGCRHVIIVGDHRQLPPTVMNKQAANEGLALSLFERLINAGEFAYPSLMSAD